MRCPHCSSEVKEVTNIFNFIYAAGLVLTGLMFTLTCVGAIIGIPMMTAGTKAAQPMLKCTNCTYHERKKP